MRMEVMLCPQNELLFWQRFAVKPPLGVLNAMLAQPVALAFGFHPFGDGGQIERFGHFNNVRRQRPVLEVSTKDLSIFSVSTSSFCR